MENRVALVTGASRGLGRAIALQLAADGMSVIVNYRNDADGAEQTCQTIEDRGGRAVKQQFDVADLDQVSNAVPRLTSEVGLIDVLVNNAGIILNDRLSRVKRKDWDQVLDVNLGGIFNCTQAVVKTWVNGRCGSRIINITSTGGERGIRYGSAYSASKAGIIGFTKSLAEELGPKGVTVNAVSPGLILTESTAEMDPQRFLSQMRLGRAGQPEEVGYLVAFLASDRAGYITGQVIRIDGGMYI